MRPIGWMDALFERVVHDARKALHATKGGSGLRAVVQPEHSCFAGRAKFIFVRRIVRLRKLPPDLQSVQVLLMGIATQRFIRARGTDKEEAFLMHIGVLDTKSTDIPKVA